MADVELNCPACKRTHKFHERVPFRAECEGCSEDLHVCLACRFFDRYVENECRETEADPVHKKERANLCEYFKPGVEGGDELDEAAKAKAKLNALFGGKPVVDDDPASEAKRKLEALFKK